MSSALSVSVPGCWQLKAALILLRSISKSVTIFEKDSTQAGTNMKLSAAFLLASAAFLSTEAAAASQGTLQVQEKYSTVFGKKTRRQLHCDSGFQCWEDGVVQARWCQWSLPYLVDIC